MNTNEPNEWAAGLTRKFHSPAGRGERGSLVAQVSNLLCRRLPVGRASGWSSASAGWKPAIQQVGNLRYEGGGVPAYEIFGLMVLLNVLRVVKGNDIACPLTPALSPREREERIPPQAEAERLDLFKAGFCDSLSFGERAGVRGNDARFDSCPFVSIRG